MINSLDKFGLFDDLAWQETNERTSEGSYNFNLTPEAQKRLRQICEEIGQTPEKILYEMFYERLAMAGLNENDIKIRIYGHASYPEFD